MIFAFANDQTLAVLDDINETRRECEGVDVEDNVYKFFDENGFKLEPIFTKANKTGKIIGNMGWVESGIFNLEKTNSKPLNIFDLLEDTLGLEPNEYFKNLNEVKAFFTNIHS